MRGAVAVGVLLAIVLGCETREAIGTSLSAPVGVSVNVIRSCAIVSGGPTVLLALACSSRVAPVTVSRGPTSAVRVVAGGNSHRFNLGYPPRNNSDPAPRPDQWLRVTVDF